MEKMCWGCPRAHGPLAYLAAFAARRAHGSLKPKDLSFKSVIPPTWRLTTGSTAEATEAIPDPGSLSGTEEWSCGLGAGWMPWNMGPAEQIHCPLGWGPGSSWNPFVCYLHGQGLHSRSAYLLPRLHIVLRASQAPVGRWWSVSGRCFPTVDTAPCAGPLVPCHCCLHTNISARLPATGLASLSPACGRHHRAHGRGSGEHTAWKEPGPVSV